MNELTVWTSIFCVAVFAGNSSVSTAGTASPAPAASPVYKYVVEPTPAGSTRPGYPVIYKVELNKHHYSSHDEIEIQVLTSKNVVRVTNQEMGHGGTLTQAAPGVFRGQGQVPGIPFFVRGMAVPMHYTATTANGNSTTATATVTF